ncbi:BrnT family toxin [Caballeronia insecticola]|uniref:BrnT family toxin n=1 Tax=Caballeronia insecticola TaxID=758793 RepID=UPI000A05BF5C
MNFDITFDPLKDAINRIQHGVSLDLAREIAWLDVMGWVDDRRDYGEVREVGFVPLYGRMFCVVFTQRGQALRIISLRRANSREENRYERSIQDMDSQHAGGGCGNPEGDRYGPDNLRPFRRRVRAVATLCSQDF